MVLLAGVYALNEITSLLKLAGSIWRRPPGLYWRDVLTILLQLLSYRWWGSRPCPPLKQAGLVVGAPLLLQLLASRWRGVAPCLPFRQAGLVVGHPLSSLSRAGRRFCSPTQPCSPTSLPKVAALVVGRDTYRFANPARPGVQFCRFLPN
ncbi:unnamed protein product [Linum trigynum]|uniref:Uncharacterized protein n=1 Tax=Linum trigynum TaxID=586398 RepID=A0AAV2D9J7_9ROSI